MSEMIVTCRFCQNSFQLNPDTEETRESRTDPSQQLKRHLGECREFSALTVGENAGWLLNLLCFTSSDPTRYRDIMISVLDWLNSGGIATAFAAALAEPDFAEHSTTAPQPSPKESHKPSSHRKRHV
jgi:hypothetical protein